MRTRRGGSLGSNSEIAPISQKSVPNQAPTDSLSRSPSVWMNAKSASSMPGSPNTVEQATSENTTIVTAPMMTNDTNCSMFARRHHTRQRDMFSASGRNT